MILRALLAMIFPLVVLAGGALAYIAPGFTSGIDPNYLHPNATWDGWSDVSNKVQVSALPRPGRNIFLIVAGEGNSAGISPTNYVPINAPNVVDINVYDGAAYIAADPLLGATPWGIAVGGINNSGCAAPPTPTCPFNGTWASRMIDNLINSNIADNVYVSNVSLSFTPIGNWVNGSSMSAASYRIAVACLRMAARGFTPNAILWGQGESDAAGGTSQADYQSRFSSLVAQAQASGCPSSVPWFIATESLSTLLAPPYTSAAIQAAQAAVVDNVTVFAGPNSDSLNTSYRTVGPRAGYFPFTGESGTYFDDNGMAANAVLWQNALHAYGPPF